MKKPVLILFIILCIPGISSSQANSQSKPRIYKTWIPLTKNQGTFTGVLYEIKDSSILISHSLYRQAYLSDNFNVTDIDYYNIKKVSFRGKNSIAVGTIIGSAIGIAGAYGIAKSVSKTEEEVAGAMFLFGSPFIIMGTGIGALIGSLRINIPINGKYELFKGNERRLEKYSFVQESRNGLNIYERDYAHKWFVGLVMGASVPSGDFAAITSSITNESLSGIGGIGGIVFGLNFEGPYGISASYLNSTYNINSITPDKWWNSTSVLAGPMTSFRINNNMLLDLKPMLGITTVSLNEGTNIVRSENGIGLYPAGAFRYNFSRRWVFLAETGYLISFQDFDGSNKNFNAYNLGVGIAYRFK